MLTRGTCCVCVSSEADFQVEELTDEDDSEAAAASELRGTLLSALEGFAEEHNATFLLVARVCATALTTAVAQGISMGAALGAVRGLIAAPWPLVVARSVAAEEECPVEMLDVPALAESIHGVLGELSVLLRGIFVSHSGLDTASVPDADLNQLFSVEFLSQLVGAFELNNVAVKVCESRLADG